ncbi:MAG: hypothetical protein GXP35_05065 [Actinobacteria bacterium]|nr:hypothetical protein [Actinomycetota bacterium]
MSVLLIAASCSSSDETPAAAVATTTTGPVEIIIDNGINVIAIPIRLTDAPDLILDDPTAGPVPLPSLPTLSSGDSTTGTTQTTTPGATTAVTVAPTTSATGPQGNATTTSIQSTSGPNTTQATPMPLSMAAIRGGEAVLLVDTSTGNSVTVRQLPVVVDETDQVGPQAPRSVDIDPVGQNLWYDECCRPPEGTSYGIDLQTDAVTDILSSGFPTIDPLGVLVASTGDSTLTLNSGGNAVATFDLDQIGENTTGTRSGWSQDGATLAVEVSVGDIPGVAIFAIDRGAAVTLTLSRVLQPPSGKRWASPTFGWDGLLRVVESVDSHILRTIDPDTGAVEKSATIPVPGIIDIDVDVSGTWWLIVDGAGRVHAFDESNLITLPGDGYSSAAW